jgi:hypothetical protein
MSIEEPEGTDEGEVLELTEEAPAPEEGQEEPEEQPEGGDEEIVISIGEEAAPASSEEAPEWVRDLRRRARELERENAELKKGKAPTVPEVGPKPTMEDCEHDSEIYERELNKWLDRKSEADRAAEATKAAETKAQQAWQVELGTYAEQKTGLGAKDFDTAEEEVTTALSPAQQAILIQGAENKALVVYALGKNPEKLRSLAAITDPVKFAFAAARLEGQTKMERRKAGTSPEGKVRGSAPLSASTDKTLERLEAEAERTGDRTKVIAHKRKQQQAR